MKLLFRQRAFSWFDSYDIYDENENTVYVVKGQLSWGHCLKIYDPEEQQELGTVKEEILTWLPKFELYEGETCIGTLKKELTFFKPKYNIDFNGWHVEGDVFEWDYTITGPDGGTVAAVSKEPFHWTDTYVLDITDPKDALYVLMFVLAIDAESARGTDPDQRKKEERQLSFLFLYSRFFTGCQPPSSCWPCRCRRSRG